jgi:perosamine synthetase
MLPYGRQSIEESDIDAVLRALRSDFLTCGPEVELFEREFAAMVGAKHAVAVCNATAALHLAMRVLGIGPGARVVTSPNTFLASANAAAYVGATPDFSDIDPVFFTLDPARLEASWQTDTKAVVAVDYAGLPCNMPEIARIARSREAFVVEDACHGIGGGFNADGKRWKLGGHPWADITTFSFHPVKTMTTGEGGILVTDNNEWAAKARLLRSHGVTRNPSDFVGLVDKTTPSSGLPPAISATLRFKSQLSEIGPWYYEMQDLGFNFRITDLQCALGRSQLRQLPAFINRRQEIVSRYNEAFANLDWLSPPALDLKPSTLDSSSFHFSLTDLSLHLYTVQIDFALLGKTRAEVMQELRDQGVGSQVLYIPVYLQPWYRRTYGYMPGKCPKAEEFYARALSLPLYPSMSGPDVDKVIRAIRALA